MCLCGCEVVMWLVPSHADPAPCPPVPCRAPLVGPPSHGAKPARPDSLAAEPLLVLRGSAEDPLFRVVSVSRMRDGGIALANASSAQLRRYDANGTMLWSSGTSDGGPGEFQQLIWSATIPGDSLIAYDGGSRRYSLFDPNGAFVRTVQPVSSDGQPVGARPVGLFDDGTVLVRLPNLGANILRILVVRCRATVIGRSNANLLRQLLTISTITAQTR